MCSAWCTRLPGSRALLGAFGLGQQGSQAHAACCASALRTEARRRRAGRRCASHSCRSRRRPRRTSGAGAPRHRARGAAACGQGPPERPGMPAGSCTHLQGNRHASAAAPYPINGIGVTADNVALSLWKSFQRPCRHRTKRGLAAESACLLGGRAGVWRAGLVPRHCAGVPAGHDSAAGMQVGSCCLVGHPAVRCGHASWRMLGCSCALRRPRARARSRRAAATRPSARPPSATSARSARPWPRAARPRRSRRASWRRCRATCRPSSPCTSSRAPTPTSWACSSVRVPGL
jgi:hypothetical protein